MAINLINWNEVRKGYREGEVEDQQDAQFLLDQERRGLGNQALRDQLAFEDQMRPLRLQQATTNNQLGALNLLGATRTNELGEVAQPGNLAVAGARGQYQTNLAGSLDLPLLAQQAGQRATMTGALGLANLTTALDQQPARAALAGNMLDIGQDQAALQRRQIAADASLLPIRTQATAQNLATGNLLSRLSGAQADANLSLLPQATQARTAEIQERLRLLARNTTNAQRRDQLVNLSDMMANPELITQLAAETGMDPVTYLDQINEMMAQQGVSLNLSSGSGAVDLDGLTPRSRQEAAMQRLLMAGRLQGQRPQVTNVRGPAAARTAAGGGAAAAPSINPITGQATATAMPTATGAEAEEDAQGENLLRSLFPTTQQVQQGIQQREATTALPKPPPIPDGVRPDDVKELSRATNWGSFSTDDLGKIVQAGQQGGYSQAQIAAAGQELYKRRLAKMRGSSQ